MNIHLDGSQRNFFEYPIEVFYEDTDSGGIVYHANYLKYMERARTKWLDRLGINLQENAIENNQIFVVTKIEIDYLKPAFLLDHLLVQTSLIDYSKVKMVFDQKIIKNGLVLINAKVQVVCIDQKTLKIIRIPEAIYQKIAL